jgi:ABC-type Na+ efflux pump permease subunit
MRYLLVLLLAIPAFGQTKAIPQRTSQSVKLLQAALQNLTHENAELTKAKAHSEAKFEELRTVAIDVYNFATREDAEYRKLLAEHTELTEKYNSLLKDANEQVRQAYIDKSIMTMQVQQQTVAAERQQRFNNALALYSAMPKVTYTPLPPPPVFQQVQSMNVHCTSNQIGTFTYTNCN